MYTQINLIVACNKAVRCEKFVQDFNDLHHTSSVKLTDEKPCLIVEVVCVFGSA